MKNKGFSLVELIIVIAIMAILAAAIAPAAVTATLANEDAYDEVASGMDSTTVIAQASAYNKGTKITFSQKVTVNNGSTFGKDLNSNLGGDVPQIKYTKNFTTGVKGSDYTWYVCVNEAGKPVVYLHCGNGTTKSYMLQPSIDTCYK